MRLDQSLQFIGASFSGGTQRYGSLDLVGIQYSEGGRTPARNRGPLQAGLTSFSTSGTAACAVRGIFGHIDGQPPLRTSGITTTVRG